jgi:hypothetical protein
MATFFSKNAISGRFKYDFVKSSNAVVAEADSKPSDKIWATNFAKQFTNF